MKRPKTFYIWLCIIQLIVCVLWKVIEIGLYNNSHPSIEDTAIWIGYIPIILKAYDIGYRQRGWDMGYDI